MQNKLLSIVFTSIFIASCGGGGGGGGSSTPTPPTPPTPPANNAPTFANVGTIEVAENTTAIGTVTATDSDGDTLTYSVTGDDSSSVSIGSGTGVLAFNTAPDFENPGSASGDNNYSITVVASDGSATGSVGIVVSVTDVDENTNSAPAFTSPASYSVNENTTAIGTVSATEAGSESWAGFAHDPAQTEGFYPIKFPNGGKITASFYAVDTSTRVYFKFEKDAYPNTTPDWQSDNLVVTSSPNTMIVNIPATTNTYKNFLMYIVDQDRPIVLESVVVTPAD
jgi:hypothetical protein